MNDPRFARLAEVLTGFSCELKKGERVLIDAFDVPDQFVIELVKAARKLGAIPYVNLQKARITRELLKGAVRQVLESATAGTTADWQDPESGRAGRASLLRVFERDGMTCGEVEHVFTDGKGTRYVLPFCQVADGSWKVAF